MKSTAVLVAVAVLVFACVVQAQTAATVRISGRALDRTGGPLPGVIVSVSGASTRQAQTDADGNYVFTDLPPGAYTLTAALVGFETASRSIVATAPGSFTVDFALYLGCGTMHQRIVPAPLLPQSISAADAVLYIRIHDAGRAVRLTNGDCVEGYEHQATVLAAIKSPRLSSDAIRLVRTGGASAYLAGDELIVFLRRHQSGAFVDAGDDVYPVRDGLVRWTRDDLPGIADGSPVRQVLEGLRNTLSMIR